MRSIEFKKWYQLHPPTQPGTDRAIVGHLLSDKLFSRVSLARSGHFLGAALLAYGFYFLNLWAGEGVQLLVALAATSAFLYIGLAVQSRTRALVLLNLLAVPILFATAYLGMTVAAEWLILSLILHGSITALQLSAVDQELRGGLFCWSVFNSVLALLLLLG